MNLQSENKATAGISGSAGAAIPAQSARDYLLAKNDKSAVGLMLQRLLRSAPWAKWRRFWTAEQAARAGEVGVTEVLDDVLDFHFFESVVADLGADGIDWSIVCESKPNGQPGISIWRVPSKDYIEISHDTL